MYKIINRKKLVATIFVDTLGRLLYWPVTFLRRTPAPPDSIRRILVIRTAYIGDVVLALPILKPLKTRFPNAEITVLACHAALPLLETNPFVDHVLAYTPFWFYTRRHPVREYLKFRRELRAQSFDLVIETRADIRDLVFLLRPVRAPRKVSYAVGGGAYFLTDIVPYPGLKHKVEYHLDLVRYLGGEADASTIEWGVYPSEHDHAAIRERLEHCGVCTPFAVLHPGSRLPLKCWAPEKFAELAKRLMLERGMTVVLVGAESEKPITESVIARIGITGAPGGVEVSSPNAEDIVDPPGRLVNLAGLLSLRELACLMPVAALFVGNDSAPMHLAAAAGIPTVGIFGPSKPVETAPFGTNCRAVAVDFPCRARCDESHCRITPENACMIELDVQAVWNRVNDLLQPRWQ